MKKVILLVIPMLLLAACASQDGGMSPGMGGNGMMERHHAEIPTKYTGLTNPIPADAESLERGGELYTVNCASCHGDGGMGDGPAGSALNPAPSPIAHSSQTEILAQAVEQDVITEEEADTFTTVHDAVEQYRIAHPEAMQSGGNATEREAIILAALVEEEIITQAQADAFTDIHDRLGNSGLMP